MWNRKISTDSVEIKPSRNVRKESFASTIRRKISTDSGVIKPADNVRKESFASSIRRKFSIGSAEVKPSDIVRKESFLTSTDQNISTDSALVIPCDNIGDIITENDIELLNIDITQSGDEVTVTVLNEIDMKWFKKSTKVFFQSIFIQNGIM